MVLQVNLLGSAQVRVDPTSIPFAADQRYQLLAYLAYHQDWVSREQLHYLFWSERSDKQAKDNLRQLLRRVRALDFLSLDVPGGLVIERGQLCWRVETDTHAFSEAIREMRWRDALAHYRGPFLSRLESGESSEFSGWLGLERERLHKSWRRALLKQAELLAAEGQHLEATALLSQLLGSDDLDEEALTLYMQLALQTDGRELALKAYEAFTRKLREDLDLASTPALAGLAEQIRTSYPEPPSADLTGSRESVTAGGSDTPAPLPAPTTSFVGRDSELAEAAALLAKPECRLLSLVGLGGTGKSRLALKAAEGLRHSYRDGVAFISLATLTSPQLIPAAIADALKLSLHGHTEPLGQLIAAISDKQLLLVLDNYEHLLAGADVAETLVSACPNLELLVTLRERLNVEAEWLLALRGLNYSQDAQLSVHEALCFDAPNLFRKRAEQVKPDFKLGQDELAQLLTICGLLEGSPLGLELAAGWMRLMPLNEIADELAKSSDFLDSSSRSKVARHQSLRVVFEHSWRLLNPKEQTALKKLSVFVGGFSRDAAAEVAGASRPILAALMDKSLLKVSDAGRYYRHMLVYEYSREKLAEEPGEYAQTEARHGDYFMQFLADQRRVLRGSESQIAFDALDKDRENVRAAWQWAVRQGKAKHIRYATFALSNYLARRARFQEAQGFFRSAATVLDKSDPRERHALATVLTEEGWHSYQLGHYAEAERLAERGLTLAETAADSTITMLALNALGCTANKTGAYKKAQSYH